jgi:hypothetical protein
MSRWNKLLTLVSVLALTFVIVNVNAPQGHGAGSAPVTVVNTPLPVTGTTTVSGTVNATQSGAWNVGITGTPMVSVTNANKSLLLVRDVDNPALQPFVFDLCAPITPAGPCPSNSFTIPSTTATGQPVQRFVVEYVSGGCGLGIGSFFDHIAVVTSVNGTGGTYQVIPTLAGQESPINVYSFAQQLRGYADAGTDARLDVSTTGAGFPQCTATVSGYLVTK